MKQFIPILLFCILSFSLSGQLADGSQAPNFSIQDIGGTNHDLYDYLEDGKSVVLDFSASWCPPCWSYHQAGTLEDVYDELGPGGEDVAMVFMLEADSNTSQPCIYGPSGCTDSGGHNPPSLGDWTNGVNYPILNPPAGEAADVRTDYSIAYWPTLYGVSPNGDVREIGQAGADEWESWLAGSFQMWNSTWEVTDGGCDASSIDFTLVGGHDDVDFAWSNGAATEDIADLSSGDYYVTLTDGNGYEVELGPIEVDNDNIFEIQFVEQGELFCYGDQNSFIEVEVDGGSGDFEYEWSNGDETARIENIGSGDYDLTVIDNNSGCEHEESFYIEEPDEMDPFYDITNAECGQEMGMVELEVDGGVYPFLYIFEDFETYEEDIELAAGEYEVMIRDYNGCETSIEFEILQTDGPEADTEVLGLFNCLNSPVFITADSSSTGNNIEYYWFDPSNLPVDTGYQAQVDSIGLYTLEVRDMITNCVTSEQVLVTEDFTTPIASAVTSGQIDCNNPTATVSGAGSTNDVNVSYMWSTQDGEIMSDPTMQNITVSASGTYSLQVTNVNSGCGMVASSTVEAVDLPELSIEGDVAFCSGSSSTLCVDAASSASIQWTLNGTVISSQNCVDIPNSGDVTAELTDENGCSVSRSVVVTSLEAPVFQVPSTTTFCANETGQICLNRTSTNSNESISWTINNQVVSTAECIDVSTSTNLQVTVTNGMTGCSESKNVSSEVLPLPMVSVATPNLLDCSNTSSTLDLSISTQGASVAWSDANGNVISNSEDIAVNTGGVYTATVTSAQGCLVQTAVEVFADLDDIADAQFAYSSDQNTIGFVNETEGDATSYLWDFGDGMTSTDISPTHTYSTSGYYNVCLSSTNDCGTTTDCEEVLAYITMQLTAEIENVTCNGDENGVVEVTVIGGLSDYEYTWNGSAQTSVDNTSSILGLPAGVYELEVKDAIGNILTESYTISEPEVIQATADITNTASGVAEGSIALSIEGGNGNYEVLWDNGMTTTTIDGLERGDYSVVITDDKGCTESGTYSVSGTTNVNEIEFLSNLTIMPNPASQYVTVDIESLDNRSLELSIVSVSGELLYSSNVSSDSRTEINVSDYSSGLYLIRLRSDNKVTMRKLLVSH